MQNVIKNQGIDVRIYDQRELMGAQAAAEVGDKISKLLEDQEFVNIIFASAPSQNEFLAQLGARGDIDWTRINAFHMDEYLGLPEDAPQAFGNFLKERLLGRLPLHSAHYINGNPQNVTDECSRYGSLLEQYPADMVCLGIGENGHIAFNDPPVADFHDRVLVKRVGLDGECRQQQVNDGCFSLLEQVPDFALTLTIPALMKARFIYAVVPGKLKAGAVFNTLHKPVDPHYPSTILRKHPHVVLFLDKQSGELL
jgi:glucosamine-6-phosphate deaminase